MTDPAFNIKQGDRIPSLDVVCYSADGAVLNLTGATGVVFNMRHERGGALVVSAGAATIVSAVGGQLRYSWGASDTATVGTYYGEFVITWPGPLQQTVPTVGKVVITVTDAGVIG